jgi:hypothetical protein
VKVFASDDGIRFQEIELMDHSIAQNNPESILYNFISDKSMLTRYLKIFAKNIGVCPAWHPGAGGRAWIFVDEVIVK